MSSTHGITAENLLRTFPIALQEDESMQALAAVTADALARRPEEISRLLIYPAIDTLDEELLDILAYDFKVDWWDGDYTLEEKRRILKDSWRVHRMLGTKAAVETAIRAIYPQTTVQEWFEYGGKPYHFKLRINVTGTAGDLEKQCRVLERVNYYKNLRSHNEGVTYVTEIKEPALVGIGAAMGAIIRMPVLEAPDNLRFEGAVRIGGRAAAITSMPVAEASDNLKLRGTLALGGRTAAITKQPITETGMEVN